MAQVEAATKFPVPGGRDGGIYGEFDKRKIARLVSAGGREGGAAIAKEAPHDDAELGTGPRATEAATWAQSTQASTNDPHSPLTACGSTSTCSTPASALEPATRLSDATPPRDSQRRSNDAAPFPPSALKGPPSKGQRKEVVAPRAAECVPCFDPAVGAFGVGRPAPPLGRHHDPACTAKAHAHDAPLRTPSYETSLLNSTGQAALPGHAPTRAVDAEEPRETSDANACTLCTPQHVVVHVCPCMHPSQIDKALAIELFHLEKIADAFRVLATLRKINPQQCDQEDPDWNEIKYRHWRLCQVYEALEKFSEAYLPLLALPPSRVRRFIRRLSGAGRPKASHEGPRLMRRLSQHRRSFSSAPKPHRAGSISEPDAENQIAAAAAAALAAKSKSRLAHGLCMDDEASSSSCSSCS
eukprot:GHVT01001766.1.p1 GENE.GHVT01001766.1~~GHVT01001766.1.p1  ORF type:complete len:413 (+),score=83.07 GHVT01001766.1:215-1453(+)